MGGHRGPSEFESPESAFVREMKATIKKREEAQTPADIAVIDREMRALMHRYLGPGQRDSPVRQRAAKRLRARKTRALCHVEQREPFDVKRAQLPPGDQD